MKRTVSMIVGVMLLGATSYLPAEAVDSAQGVIQGLVRDAKGAPVSTAIVRAKNLTTKVSKIGLTDLRGRFYLPEVQDGQYAVTVSKKGFKANGSKRFDLHGTEAVDLTMQETPTIDISQLSTSDIMRHLPDAPGKTEFGNTCGGCHGLERAVMAGGRSRADWDELITRMGKMPGGYLTINDRTKRPLLDYVSTFLPPDTTLVDEITALVKKDPQEVPQGDELVYTEYDLPTPNSVPHTVKLDKRGEMAWFSEYAPGNIGKVDLRTGVATEFPLKTPDHHPHGLTTAADGTVWFAAPPHVLGKMDPKTEKMEEIQIPLFEDGKEPYPHSLTIASDGKIWFSETHRPSPGAISSYDPASKTFKRYHLEPGDIPYGIIDHEGMIWFTVMIPGKIGVIDPKTGDMQFFTIPTQNTSTRRLRFDSKGRLWFGEYSTSKLGVFDPSTKKFTEYDLPYHATPYSIYVDGKDQVWVASFERDTFIKFDPDTKKMVEYPLPAVGIEIRDMWPEGPDNKGRWWFAQSGWNQIASVEFVHKPQSTANR